jgi:hypothetical protein
MASTAPSPLGLLIDSALEALGACAIDPSLRPPPDSPSETVEQIAAGLLVAMAHGEISDDLDLKAVSLLGAAAVAGLQRIDLEEPGVHDAASAIRALEDLLRRTGNGRS